MSVSGFCLAFVVFAVGVQDAPPPGDASTGASVEYDLLRVVPADAGLVVTLKNLSELDRKLSGLVATPGDELNLLSAIQNSLEMVAGWDTANGAALAILPSSGGLSADEDFSDGLVLVIPTADRSALLTFLAPKPLEGGYYSVTLRGRESYAGFKGRFTIFAPKLDTVRRVVDAKSHLADRLTSYVRKRLEACEAVVWFDREKIAAIESMVVGEGLWGSLLRDGILSLVGVSDLPSSAAIGMRLEPSGVKVEVHWNDAQKNITARLQPAHDSLLNGLPDEQFALLHGAAIDDLGHSGSLMRGAISLAVAGKLLDLSDSEGLTRALSSFATKIQKSSTSVSLLDAEGFGRIGWATALQTRNGANAFVREFESVVMRLKSVPFVDPNLAGLIERIEFRTGAETIDGIRVDQLVLDLSKVGSIDGVALAEAFGSPPLIMRIGVVDEHAVAMAIGGGAERFGWIISAVKSNEAPAAAGNGIARVASRFAHSRTAEAYISSANLATIQILLLAVSGSNKATSALPPVAAPFGMSLHAPHAGETQLDIFIPSELLATFTRGLLDK